MLRHSILCSMSRKGDCYDNAAMESFFHCLKVEQTEGKRYATREDARADEFKHIESSYNQKRRHSTLNDLSPCDLEGRRAA
jgi:putative transposase